MGRGSSGFSRILGILENSRESSRESSQNREGNDEQTMRINSGRLETDHFHCREGGRSHFLHLPSLSGPVGSKRSQIELKTQNKSCARRDLSVWTAESFVLTLAPIGMDPQHPWSFFPHLPRTRPGAETRRPVSKSILIGAPIPYAERPPDRNHGGPTVISVL